MASQQRSCFVISPIGPDNTDVREMANDFLELLVEPALEKYGFVVTRADRIAHPTAITTDIVKLVQESDLCLIDLTDSNPNVFYECGRRHETGRPFIQMVRKGAEQSLPFDVAGIRTVIYDVSSPRAARESVVKLQAFIDAIVNAGFKASTSGESLSSIAQGIERIERKVNQLIATASSTIVGSIEDSEEFDIVADLMQTPREAFLAALKKGKAEKAFGLLGKVKKSVALREYAASVALLASTGHGRCFERMDSELREVLLKPNEFAEHDDVIHVFSEGAYKYFENTGERAEGLKYLQGLSAELAGNVEVGDPAKAHVANKVGMLAWSLGEYELCIKYTKLAFSLSPDPSYCYNLALCYERTAQEQSLHQTLKILAELPDLDSDHRRLLVRCGYEVPSNR